MPTYDFKCEECEETFEGILPITQLNKFARCPHCCSVCFSVFSPNRNIIIPNAFKAGYINPGYPGEESAPYSSNNAVHAPKRETFTEAFDANYKKAGGIG